MDRSRMLPGLIALAALTAGCPDDKNSKSGTSGTEKRPPASKGAGVTSTAPSAPGEVMSLEERYPNGSVQIRREGKLRADNVFVNHGNWVEFDENGQKIGEMTYVEGVIHGPITLWHSNGQKEGEGFFENGEKSGLWQIWDEEGRKIREESYKDNVNDGMWVYWDEEGNVIQYEHWIKGERQLDVPSPTTAPTPRPASMPASQPSGSGGG